MLLERGVQLTRKRTSVTYTRWPRDVALSRYEHEPGRPLAAKLLTKDGEYCEVAGATTPNVIWSPAMRGVAPILGQT
jgi:hypothetical protein